MLPSPALKRFRLDPTLLARLASVAIVAAALPATSIQAALITIVNPSFEDPIIADGSFLTTAPPTGWTTFGTVNSFLGRDVGVLNPATTALYTDPAPHGANVAVVFLLNGPSSPTGIQQTLSDTLQLNTQYTLTLSIGNIAEIPSGFAFTGFPGYRVSLLAGGEEIASDNNSLLPGEGQFLPTSLSFTTGSSHAQAGEALGIRLLNLDAASGIEVNFDNLQLQAVAVPEPSQGLLAAAALLLSASIARRFRT